MALFYVMISFHSADLSFKLDNMPAIRKWLLLSAKSEGKSINELSFVFCTDEFLHTLNVQYLQHDTYTDIITFDYTNSSTSISGELFISLDRICENALKFDVSVDDELHRVMIHGVLHLCGFSDKSFGKKRIMSNKEDFYLSLRNFI
jgi:probable rRNA maturation factor